MSANDFIPVLSYALMSAADVEARAALTFSSDTGKIVIFIDWILIYKSLKTSNEI